MIRILLAEDDDAMRQYLARALERSGYEVVSVDRGTEALPLLETDRFDLLLTDIVMPEMDGIELAQHAAKIAPDMRVMFITGFAAVTLKAGKACRRRRCSPSRSTCAIWCWRLTGCLASAAPAASRTIDIPPRWACKALLPLLRCSRTFKYAALRCSKTPLFDSIGTKSQ